MEIRQLEYFISASALGNLTKVAERHYVSQPNITVAIKKLGKVRISRSFLPKLTR